MLRSFSKVMFTSKKIISTAKLYNFETQNMSRVPHKTTCKTKPRVLGERVASSQEPAENTTGTLRHILSFKVV